MQRRSQKWVSQLLLISWVAAFPGTGGTCGVSLGGGASCTVVIEFAPTGLGPFTDTVDFSYNNGIAVVNSTRNIQGTAGAPANITITDGPTYDFGTQATGSINTHTFTLNNTGAVDATTITGTGLAAPFQFAGGTYPGTAGTCGATISAGASCTIVVAYQPSALGTLDRHN